MKKLIAAAVCALAVGAFADETEKVAEAAAPAQVEAAAKPHAPRGFDRAKYEERIKQRKLERKAKVVALLAEAGVPAEKAEATAEAIDEVYTRRPQRPPRPPRPPRKPGDRKAPAAAPAAE